MRPRGEKSVSLHLHVMQCQLGLSSSVRPSVCPSVSFLLSRAGLAPRANFGALWGCRKKTRVLGARSLLLHSRREAGRPPLPLRVHWSLKV